MAVKGLGKQMYSIELRDLFAMAAIAGVYANQQLFNDADFEELAAHAYQQADAMLEARETKDNRPPEKESD